MQPTIIFGKERKINYRRKNKIKGNADNELEESGTEISTLK